LQTKSDEAARRTRSTRATSTGRAERVADLLDHLLEVRAGVGVTEARLATLRARLHALFDGPVRPDAAVVRALADDLSWALADGRLSPGAVARRAAHLGKVGGAHGTAGERTRAIAEVRGILDSGGVSTRDGQAVASHLHAIARSMGQVRDDVARPTGP
jgi:hypothetical protein